MDLYPQTYYTLVVLGLCNSVLHQYSVSETVGGRMIHFSINNSSSGQGCICCQDQGSCCACVHVCVLLYWCAVHREQ